MNKLIFNGIYCYIRRNATFCAFVSRWQLYTRAAQSVLLEILCEFYLLRCGCFFNTCLFSLFFIFFHLFFSSRATGRKPKSFLLLFSVPVNLWPALVCVRVAILFVFVFDFALCLCSCLRFCSAAE